MLYVFIYKTAERRVVNEKKGFKDVRIYLLTSGGKVSGKQKGFKDVRMYL
jgi:hypothetical protein